jgi:histidine ammonia-lyase
MALPLIGLGEVIFDGENLSGIEALEKTDLKPIKLAAKEGLALTNGTTVMTAVGMLETQKAIKLAGLADVSGCLSLEALNGTTLAFDARIHALRPHPRQNECAENLREILEGSEFTRDYDPANVQDAYTLRCMPQVHGACRDAIAYAKWLLKLELNSVTDNPLIFCDENCENIDVISGGNFHGEPLALAFDYLAIALSELGNISERRIMRLTDESSNAHILPAFLTENGGLNSGFMIVQYTAAALCTENKVLSHPASVDTIPSSANVEDHVSMGVTAVLKLRQIADNLQTIISLELFAAAQGIDFRRKIIGEEKELGNGTRDIYKLIRSEVPFIEEDTVMYPFMRKVEKIVKDEIMEHNG